MDPNPIKQDTIKIYNFGMEIIYNEFSTLNHMELVKNFVLDVDYKEDLNGLYITQKQNGKDIILKQPYNISDSARKVNKGISHIASGFTRIEYAKKKNLVKFINPPESIPIGCWCIHCENKGPNGHSTKCSLPNFSSLKLTLRGFVECLFSSDKIYQSRMLEITDNTKMNIVFLFLNSVLSIIQFNLKLVQISKLIDNIEDLIDAQTIIDMKKLAMLVSSFDEEIFIQIAREINNSGHFFLIEEEFESKKKSIDDFLTDFNLEDIKTISGLNKSGKKEYFPGTVILQYSLNNKKTTIRFYDNFIHFITVPLNMNYNKVIRDVFSRFNRSVSANYVPLNVIIEVAKGSFNIISENSPDIDINLQTLYNCFHPVDTYKNPMTKNDYMYIKEFTKPDESIVKLNFTENENTKYEFTITQPENKRMTMIFVEYNLLSRPGYYKITAQIHGSGIIQLTFGYTNGSKEYIKLDNSLKYNKIEIIQVGKGIENLLEYQTNFMDYLVKNQLDNTVKKSFDSIKMLFFNKLNEIYEKNPDIFIKTNNKKKTSDRIYNIVPGILPYRKKIFPHAGNLVDFFDDNNDDWNDNYGWSSDDLNRGYIVDVVKRNYKTIYKIAKGIPLELPILKIDFIDKNFMPDKYSTCPVVETPNGRAYLLEEYNPIDKNKFWVLPITENPTEYDYKYFRIYKYSITGKIDKGDVQVCSKTISNGTEMRPYPYSFYGNCPGGMNEYVNRIGIRSRKDNKFYPVCEKVKDRNETDREVIDFLLNGLTQNQLEDADIDQDIEFEIYGVKIDDKFAGTFKPGTIDKGNKITFWNNEEFNPKWTEGIIVDYKKDHGLGNDLNYVKFIIEVEMDAEHKRYEVTGDQFHPMHREKRNFEGLNNIIPDLEKQKIFMTEIAKELNLVTPTIPLPEVDDKTRTHVLNLLSNMYGKKYGFKKMSKNIIPFVNENIKNLGKRPYIAALIPTYGIRCKLFIHNQKNQYIINETNSIMMISIDSNENLPDNTLIDGYITDTRKFYPIDLLFFKGNIEMDNYISIGNFGRLFKLQNIVSKLNTSLKFSNSVKVESPLGKSVINIENTQINEPYVGPITEKMNLLKFIEKYKKNNNILFIPQNGNGDIMIWLHNTTNTKLVLQLINKYPGKNKWALGLPVKGGNQILLDIPVVLGKNYHENDYITFNLNIMNSGILNMSEPYINIVKSSEDEAISTEETINVINLLLYSVNREIFENSKKWEFSNIKMTYAADESFRSRLVSI
jgi:hypothetical protein